MEKICEFEMNGFRFVAFAPSSRFEPLEWSVDVFSESKQIKTLSAPISELPSGGLHNNDLTILDELVEDFFQGLNVS